MIIDYSESGTLRQRFEKDNIESILESGDQAINNYFEGLKQEEMLLSYNNAFTSKSWITWESASTGFGRLLIR